MRIELKLAIVRSGETQRELARKLGWTEDLLSKVVHDVRAVSKTEKKLLCEALGVKEEEIFPAEELAVV